MAPCARHGASRVVNDARGGIMLAAGRVRSKKNQRKKTPKNSPPHPKHTTKTTAVRHRVQLETTCEETRHTR